MDRWGDTVGPADNTTMNMAFSTTEEETAAGGWTRINKPVGAHPPDRAITAGMRGEEDIDDDVTAGPGDQSSCMGA